MEIFIEKMQDSEKRISKFIQDSIEKYKTVR